MENDALNEFEKVGFFNMECVKIAERKLIQQLTQKHFCRNCKRLIPFGRFCDENCEKEFINHYDDEVQKMLITNATGFKLRFSIARAISEDEMEEAFAYVIAKGCSLNIPKDDNFTISVEKEVQKMAKIIQVIETLENRGDGSEKDPNRNVYQLWTLDGRLIFESDPFEKIQKMEIKKIQKGDFDIVITMCEDEARNLLNDLDEAKDYIGFYLSTSAVRTKLHELLDQKMEIIFFKEIKVIEALKKVCDIHLYHTTSKAELIKRINLVKEQLNEIIQGLEKSEDFVGVIRDQKMEKEEFKQITEILGKFEMDLKQILLITDKRFEAMKKVIGDYLELSSQLSIASVKANLKSV